MEVPNACSAWSAMRKAMDVASVRASGGGVGVGAVPAWQRLSTGAASSDHRLHTMQSPRLNTRAGQRLAVLCGCAMLCTLLIGAGAALVSAARSAGSKTADKTPSPAGGLEQFVESRLQLPAGFVATK